MMPLGVGAFHSDDAIASAKGVGAFHSDDATAIADRKQSGAEEAWWAHNPQVVGSKPTSAMLLKIPTY